MTVLLAVLVTIGIPFLAVSALLKFSERLQDRQEAARERQIELTDAIHWELGAVAAPVVRHRLFRGWRVFMAIPLDRAGEVGAVVRLTAKLFRNGSAAEPLEIVLRPAARSAAPLSLDPPAPRSTTTRPLAA
jgi:hypothetical protein